jgi:hypothetical protein
MKYSFKNFLNPVIEIEISDDDEKMFAQKGWVTSKNKSSTLDVIDEIQNIATNDDDTNILMFKWLLKNNDLNHLHFKHTNLFYDYYNCGKIK